MHDMNYKIIDILRDNKYADTRWVANYIDWIRMTNGCYRSHSTYLIKHRVTSNPDKLSIILNAWHYAEYGPGLQGLRPFSDILLDWLDYSIEEPF